MAAWPVVRGADADFKCVAAIDRVQRLKLEVVGALEGLRNVAVGTGHLSTSSGMQLRRAIAYFSTRVKVRLAACRTCTWHAHWASASLPLS